MEIEGILYVVMAAAALPPTVIAGTLAARVMSWRALERHLRPRGFQASRLRRILHGELAGHRVSLQGASGREGGEWILRLHGQRVSGRLSLYLQRRSIWVGRPAWTLVWDRVKLQKALAKDLAVWSPDAELARSVLAAATVEDTLLRLFGDTFPKPALLRFHDGDVVVVFRRPTLFPVDEAEVILGWVVPLAGAFQEVELVQPMPGRGLGGDSGDPFGVSLR